ncbi:MAG: hypothetical protein ACI37S_08820 [Candidatus Gastranaerophilaceae bacterium]
MGLAASQCRLLFITSRQTDVSYKMQRLSNSLLTLARDDEDIATEYNRRLNATKMVPTSDFMDLSYSAMMGDNAMVTGNPKFINERLSNGQVGRVVLADGEYSKLGLSTSSGKPGDIKSQTGCATSTAYAAKMAGVSESEAAGYINKASGVSNTTATSDVKALAADIQKIYGSYPTSKTNSTIQQLISKMGNFGSGIPDYYWGGYEHIESNLINSSTLSNLSYDMLLNGNYTYIVGDYNHSRSSAQAGKDACNKISSIMQHIISDFSKALGIDCTQGSVYDKIKNFQDSMFDLLSKGTMDRKDGGDHGSWYVKDKSSDLASKGLFGAASSYEAGDGEDDHVGTTVAVNISELARRILNEILSSVQNKENVFDANVYDGDNNDKNLMGRQNSLNSYQNYNKNEAIELQINEKGFTVNDYEELIKNYCNGKGDADAVIEYLKQAAGVDKTTATTATATPESKVLYYSKMFDELNAYGWTAGGTGENIIANVKNDNYLYNHGVFSNSVEYTSVPDEETQKGAEAWYNTETKKIKRKEKEIEMQQTQLQSEYTALNTEIESVKSIISKNIERSFQYCNA